MLRHLLEALFWVVPLIVMPAMPVHASPDLKAEVDINKGDINNIKKSIEDIEKKLAADQQFKDDIAKLQKSVDDLKGSLKTAEENINIEGTQLAVGLVILVALLAIAIIVAVGRQSYSDVKDRLDKIENRLKSIEEGQTGFQPTITKVEKHDPPVPNKVGIRVLGKHFDYTTKILIGGRLADIGYRDFAEILADVDPVAELLAEAGKIEVEVKTDRGSTKGLFPYVWPEVLLNDPPDLPASGGWVEIEGKGFFGPDIKVMAKDSKAKEFTRLQTKQLNHLKLLAELPGGNSGDKVKIKVRRIDNVESKEKEGEYKQG